MFNALSPTYKGIILALSGYTAFAIADICAKWLAQYYSIYQIIHIEGLVSLVILLALSKRLGGSGDFIKNRANWKIHAMRGALNFILLALLTYCYKMFPLADVYTLLFTKPFFATLLALWFFGDKASKSQWLAMTAGFAGVVIAMRPGTGTFDPLMLLPLGLTVLIAFLFVSARFLNKPSLFSLGFAPVIGTVILSAPFVALTFKIPELTHIPVFLLLGTCACVGILAISNAFRTAAASVVSPFLYIEMLWALVFGYILFNDTPDAWMLTGAAVIIASGIYLIESERRAPPRNP